MNEEKRYIETELMEIEGEKVFVASNSDVDRHGESINVDGWELDRYKANPVILWAHDHKIPAIGRATKIGFKTINGKKCLTFVPEFHKKSELSQLVSDLVDSGFIKATSVGFIGKEWDKDYRNCLKQELLENSIVNVGAHQDALNLATAKGYSEETIKAVMPEALYESRIKELEGKISSMEENIKSLSEITPQTGDKGREPDRAINKKKNIERLSALKELNKQVEKLNILFKEKNA